MKKVSTLLFYSYCHADENHKNNMEISLNLLKNKNLLEDWSDRNILAGQKLSERIKTKMQDSNIIVFLISPDFLNSPACIKEWELAKDMLERDQNKTLISVIVRDCPWQDFDDMAEYLVLPTDGKPITEWSNQDTAWKIVYEGIKKVVEEINNTFNLRPEFEKEISSLEFCSQTKEEVVLNDLFVFPNLKTHPRNSQTEETIKNAEELLKKKRVLIRGDDQCGKSKLCGHLFLELCNKNKPVIFIDLEEIKSKKPNENIFSQKYSEQFSGDYNLWVQQNNKTIIFDNLSHEANSLRHVVFAKELYETIIVSTSNDRYSAYFKDELKLTEFSIIEIAPFTHVKQELLIKKWITLKQDTIREDIETEHGEIDKIERNINEIIINNKILPRYPFFILSILQTHEAFMPQDVQITAYGHCYYALLVAHLIKCGIEKSDDAINKCFNFSSHLAFVIYKNNFNDLNISKHEFDKFIEDYKNNFVIDDATINRLCNTHGIFKQNQNGYIYFSLNYSYYFFLGRYLSNTYNENADIVSKMAEKSYVRKNTLSLIFAIHHTNDLKIIDEILLHTLCAVDNVAPSKLNEDETHIFQYLLESVPKQILSDKSIEVERLQERHFRDQNENDVAEDDDIDENPHKIVNQIYKSQKNIEILSQILKNKYGNLKKNKVEEIIEIICDAGLRLVSALLCNDYELQELTKYIEKRYEESDDFDMNKKEVEKKEDITKLLTYIIFLWTMGNIEKVVSSISKPEIAEIVKTIRDKKNTPAYDIIYYFYLLDTASCFDEKQKKELKRLVSKYDSKGMLFLQKVLSIRTQHYINTHKIKAPLKQSVSSLLGIAYKA